METAKKPLILPLIKKILQEFVALATYAWWALVMFLLIFDLINRDYIHAIFVMCNMIFVVLIRVYIEMKKIAHRPINIEPHINLNSGEVAQIFFTIMRENDSFVVMEKSTPN